MKIYLETKRLILRSWLKSDYKFWKEINQDPVYRKFSPEIMSDEEVEKTFNILSKFLDDHDYGHFICVSKETGEPIGVCGIYTMDEIPEYREKGALHIGWGTKRNEWRKGYAYEAAMGVFNFVKENNLKNEIFAYTSVDNFPSESIMKKLKMKKVCIIDDFVTPEGIIVTKQLLYKINLK